MKKQKDKTWVYWNFGTSKNFGLIASRATWVHLKSDSEYE
jgi:hypothetical protein